MIQITEVIDLYEYNELDEKAKEKAIDTEVKDCLQTIPYENMSPNMKKAIDKAESMLTPWFTGSYIWEYCKDEIEETLTTYLFLKNGKFHSHKDV
ncbi:MAG: hypothetical protein WC346_11680 [Methanogenium sp.]|jgi:hypothetical protein